MLTTVKIFGFHYIAQDKNSCLPCFLMSLPPYCSSLLQPKIFRVMCTEQNSCTVLLVLSILFTVQLNQFHFYLIPIRIHWIIPEGNSNHQILWTIFYLSCILIHHFLLKCLTLSLPNTLVFCLYLYCCCLVANSCPALCGPMDCSLPGSTVYGIFQTRVLKSISIYFSIGSS